MKIHILTDNTPSQDHPQLIAEHGLSLYIESDGPDILCDTGVSGIYAANARAMGIEPQRADFLFLSHGHNDHCGGTATFLRESEAPIYVHKEAFEGAFNSTRRGGRRSISSDRELPQLHPGRFRLLGGTTAVAQGVTAVQCAEEMCSTPLGNKFLTREVDGKEIPDDFVHELSLTIETPKGLVIISPCSHRGAVNIMKSCCEATGCNEVYAFVGGLHFVESEETAHEVATFKREVEEHFPRCKVITGHCTCDKAKSLLAQTMPQVTFFATGDTIEL